MGGGGGGVFFGGGGGGCGGGARQPAPAARVAERIDDPLQLPLPSGSAAAAPARQDEILKIARDNPAAVASGVRSWVGTEAKGA